MEDEIEEEREEEGRRLRFVGLRDTQGRSAAGAQSIQEQRSVIVTHTRVLTRMCAGLCACTRL